MLKVAVLYYSVTENTKKVSEYIKEGALENKGVEVRLMSIENIDEEYLQDSKVVFIGTPTYTGTLAWQMSKFIQTNKIKWKNKICSVFATEKFLGGGADTAEIAIVSQMLVKGMFIYSVGASEGLPYTHFGTVCLEDGSEDLSQTERAKIYGNRVIRNVLNEFKIK